MTDHLKAAIGSYGHTAALKDRSIQPAGAEFDLVEVTPLNAAFRRMVRDLEFDVSELAVTTYLVAKEHAKQLNDYEKLCAKWKEAPADVALAWLLHQPAVTAPIIGPRTQAQLDGSLRALKIKLKPAQLAELDKLFPGPGGTAPEAYAW